MTGDAEKDMESFKELFTEQINKATSLQLGGYFEEATSSADDEDDNSSSTAISFSESVSGQSNAAEVTSTVAENTTGSNANGKGAQVINAAVSAAISGGPGFSRLPHLNRLCAKSGGHWQKKISRSTGSVFLRI